MSIQLRRADLVIKDGVSLWLFKPRPLAEMGERPRLKTGFVSFGMWDRTALVDMGIIQGERLVLDRLRYHIPGSCQVLRGMKIRETKGTNIRGNERKMREHRLQNRDLYLQIAAARMGDEADVLMLDPRAAINYDIYQIAKAVRTLADFVRLAELRRQATETGLEPFVEKLMIIFRSRDWAGEAGRPNLPSHSPEIWQQYVQACVDFPLMTILLNNSLFTKFSDRAPQDFRARLEVAHRRHAEPGIFALSAPQIERILAFPSLTTAILDAIEEFQPLFIPLRQGPVATVDDVIETIQLPHPRYTVSALRTKLRKRLPVLTDRAKTR